MDSSQSSQVRPVSQVSQSVKSVKSGKQANTGAAPAPASSKIGENGCSFNLSTLGASFKPMNPGYPPSGPPGMIPGAPPQFGQPINMSPGMPPGMSAPYGMPQMGMMPPPIGMQYRGAWIFLLLIDPVDPQRNSIEAYRCVSVVQSNL
eukprot:8314227-Pyramimonas_sp.AAC.2